MEDLSIRVRNNSAVDFDEVRVNYPSSRVNYGSVRAGAASAYEKVESAYRYAHIEAKHGEKSYVLQPIDYTGETELPPGRYTYVLTVAGDRLSVSLEED